MKALRIPDGQAVTGSGLSAGALGGIALASALVPLGSTMIVVALLDIGGDLDVSTAQATWLVTGYLAAMAVVQPLGGRLGDAHGHRRAFLIGLSAFLVAWALAAAAPSFTALLALRLCQAGAGGLMLPNASALILHGVPADRRGRAFGVLATSLAMAAAVGPLVGGAVTGAMGWRAMFLVTLPLGLVALPLVLRATGGSGGRQSRTPARAGAAGVGFLLRSRPFALAAVTILLHNLVLYLALVLVPILAHQDLGLGHGEAGALMATLTVGLLAGAFVGGRAADRHGRRAVAVVGGAIAVVGAAPLPFIAAAPGIPGLALPLAGLGIGIGLAGPALQAAAVEAAPAGAAAIAGGLYMSMRYAGGIAASVIAAALAGADAFAAGLAIAAAAAVASTATAAGLAGGRPWHVADGTSRSVPPPMAPHPPAPPP